MEWRIIRHARLAQPNIDIVVTYFVNPSMLSQLQEGNIPLSIAAHEKVLRHYNVSSVFLAQEVAQRIASGKTTWNQYEAPPKPYGNAIAAEMIEKLLTKAWKQETPKGRRAHSVPET